MKLVTGHWSLVTCCLISLMVPADVGADEILIRILPDVSPATPPSEDAAVDAIPFTDETLARVLRDEGITQLRPIAPYWWNVADREYRDIHGNVVSGLADFRGCFSAALTADVDGGAISERLMDHPSILDAAQPEPGTWTGCGDPITVDDPLFFKQWSLHNDGSFPGSVADVDINFLEATAYHDRCTRKVAVLDTGIQQAPSHEDLQAVLNVDLSESFMSGQSIADATGHGTSMAGVAAAVTNNGEGIASPGGTGFTDSNRPLVVLKSGDTGGPDYEAVTNAIAYAAQNGIPVLSMSFGFCVLHGHDDLPTRLLRNAIRNAYTQGLLMFASSGNGDTCEWRVHWTYPAAFGRLVNGVGHIRSDGTRNAGYPPGLYPAFWVDLVAPGGALDTGPGEITTTCLSPSTPDYHDGDTSDCSCTKRLPV